MEYQHEFVKRHREMGNQHDTAFRAERVIDPVCGMKIDEIEAGHQAEHRGNTYYFCDPKCRRAFEEDPEKYTRLLRFARNDW